MIGCDILASEAAVGRVKLEAAYCPTCPTGLISESQSTIADWDVRDDVLSGKVDSVDFDAREPIEDDEGRAPFNFEVIDPLEAIDLSELKPFLIMPVTEELAIRGFTGMTGDCAVLTGLGGSRPARVGSATIPSFTDKDHVRFEASTVLTFLALPGVAAILLLCLACPDFPNPSVSDPAPTLKSKILCLSCACCVAVLGAFGPGRGGIIGARRPC